MLVAWERVDSECGHSVGGIEAVDGGFEAHGAEVLVGPGPVHSCSFTVRLDRRWHTRRVHVASLADRARTLDLVSDGEGHWTRAGRPAAGLAGCTDVDVAASPLTNTFPIRRLTDLPVGETSTLDVAWVDVPSLDVLRVRQSYTRLGPHAWRYADDTYGAFELTVDDDGVVVDYTGLVRRVRP